jgi:hypothetical protein
MSKPANTPARKYRQDVIGKVIHGAAVGGRTTPEYHSWQSAVARCHNPNGKHYPRYGGRGIRVCERWRKSFAAFLADMGLKPDKSSSIDRIDNDGGYWCGKPECPECGPLGRTPNCRWADRKTQARNRRSNHVVEFRGERRTVTEWAEHVGIPRNAITLRLKNGWGVERSLTTPYMGPHGALEAEHSLTAILTPEKVREIRDLHSKGVSRRELAGRYGVAVDTIRGVVTGRTWKRV